MEIKPLYSFGYLLPTFITKNAKNSAFQDNYIAAIFCFVTIGLVVVLCVISRMFRRNPHHNKKGQNQVLDILCPIIGHFGPASPSNQILGTFWQFMEVFILILKLL